MLNFKNVNPKKLFQELANSGIQWDKGIVVSDNEVSILFRKNTDMRLAQSIIDAHDPTPIPPRKSETELLKERLEATEQALIQIIMEGMM